MKHEPESKHYQLGTIQPMDFIRSQGWEPEFSLANIVKYASRAQHKGTPIEDLKKIQDYAEFACESFGGSGRIAEMRAHRSKDQERLDFADLDVVAFLNAVEDWNNLSPYDHTPLRAVLDRAMRSKR